MFERYTRKKEFIDKSRLETYVLSQKEKNTMWFISNSKIVKQFKTSGITRGCFKKNFIFIIFN